MSDESTRETLLSWLTQARWCHFCGFPNDKEESKQVCKQIRKLIQHKPKVDEGYIRRKAVEIYHLSNIIQMEDTVRQIIRDVKGEDKMSDERKVREELIKKLKCMLSCSKFWMSREGISEEILEEYEKAHNQIRQLIQQKPEEDEIEVICPSCGREFEYFMEDGKKPEIDEQYVEEKLIELNRLNNMFPESKQQRDEINRKFITQIIGEVQEVKK